MATELKVDKVGDLSIPIPVDEVTSRPHPRGKRLFVRVADSRHSDISKSGFHPEHLTVHVSTAAGTLVFSYDKERVAKRSKLKFDTWATYLRLQADDVRSGAAIMGTEATEGVPRSAPAPIVTVSIGQPAAVQPVQSLLSAFGTIASVDVLGEGLAANVPEEADLVDLLSSSTATLMTNRAASSGDFWTISA